MAKLLCTLARHWVRVEPEHLQELQWIRSNLNPGRHGMTEKNRATLRQFEEEGLADRFLMTPSRVANQLKRKSRLTYVDAVRFRTALATELLIVAPVRCQNLVQIDIERNLIEVGSGGSRRLHLYFPASAVKNDTEIEFVLPKSTVELLDYYLEHVRSHFIRMPNSYLFPGRGKLHQAGPGLSVQIASFVEKEVGVRLTPHQFRHLAGFFYLKHNPGGHEVVRRLLGHKSIETTIQFYAGMEVAEAIKHYDQHIAKRREEIRRAGLRRPGQGGIGV